MVLDVVPHPPVGDWGWGVGMQWSSLPCCCYSPSVSWTCLGSASLFSLGCPSWLLRMTSVTTHSPEAPPHSEGVGQSCTVTLPHSQGGQRAGVCQSHDPKLLWCIQTRQYGIRNINCTIHKTSSWRSMYKNRLTGSLSLNHYRRTGFNCENLIIANCEFSGVRKLLIRKLILLTAYPYMQFAQM